MQQKIEFIYFDIGGVLLRWQEFFETIAIAYKKTRTEIEASYFRYDDLACRGEITTQVAWERACADLRITPTADLDFATRWIETFTPMHTTHTLLRTISEHYPIGLLTNIHKDTYDICLNRGLIPNLPYQAIIKSCDIGMVKPEKEIYLYAQQQAHVPHEAIFFTDDLANNIETAHLLGWQTVQFDSDQPDSSIAMITRKLLETSR